MKIQTQPEYENAKAALEGIGFSGLPLANDIDFTKPDAVILNVSGVYKKASTTNMVFTGIPNG